MVRIRTEFSGPKAPLRTLKHGSNSNRALRSRAGPGRGTTRPRLCVVENSCEIAHEAEPFLRRVVQIDDRRQARQRLRHAWSSERPHARIVTAVVRFA